MVGIIFIGLKRTEYRLFCCSVVDIIFYEVHPKIFPLKYDVISPSDVTMIAMNTMKRHFEKSLVECLWWGCDFF